MQRLGRAMVRNISDIQEQSKETTTASISTVAGREPVETVGVPRYDDPIVTNSHADVPAQDIVANAVLMAAFTVEGAGRLWRRRRLTNT